MRKPATAADLDAAPVGTIAVDSHGDAYQKSSDSETYPTWWGPRLRRWQTARDVLTNSPVTIIWTPEEDR